MDANGLVIGYIRNLIIITTWFKHFRSVILWFESKELFLLADRVVIFGIRADSLARSMRLVSGELGSE